MNEARPNIIPVLKQHLQRDVAGLCRELGLEGRPRGNVWQTKNPRRADRHGGSFTVWVKGAEPGCWKDFASGEKGDVLALVAYLKGCDTKTAVQWAMDRFGLKAMEPEARAKMEREAEAARERARKAEAEAQAKRRKRAQIMFSKADPFISQTVMAYWKLRGLTMPPTFEARWFRSFERFEWWLGRDAATGEVGPEFPAMIAGFVDAQGKQQACHITYLAHDGRGKAPVDKPKLMWPEHLGLVIRVARGETGLSPEDAAKAGKPGPVVITEGIEDALTIACACPELRVWCAGSLAGYGALYDHGCVSSWIVARDNDWGKPQAAAQFEKAMARLRRFGKPTREVASAAGKDFNDQWRL